MENKTSSNQQMEEQLIQLKSIRRVEAPEHLYTRIMRNIQSNIPSIISMRWVIGAAAGLALFFAADAYLIYQNQEAQKRAETASLIPSQSNHLYYE